VDNLQQVFSEDDKYRLPVPNLKIPMPITDVVVLIQQPNNSVEMQEMKGVRALTSLMALVHQSYLPAAMGIQEQIFGICGRIVSQATVYTLSRPWGFTHMDETINAIASFFPIPKDGLGSRVR
jgi:hypothetical protein